MFDAPITRRSFMATFIACLVVLASAIALGLTPAAAQIDPRTCGVLDGPGCNPNQCSILDGPGCQAQAQGGGVGENLQLTLGTRAAGDAKKPAGDLNTLRDLFAALLACWLPPAVENAYPGMQMSMRFSLTRDGKLIGNPRVTFASREVSQKTRDLYRDAFTQSLQGCAPFAITRSFGGAIAGRPIVVRVIENRDDVAKTKPRV
jgi:hypothetical protein